MKEATTMTTEQYYAKLKEINENQFLGVYQKQILVANFKAGIENERKERQRLKENEQQRTIVF